MQRPSQGQNGRKTRTEREQNGTEREQSQSGAKQSDTGAKQCNLYIATGAKQCYLPAGNLMQERSNVTA